MDKLIIYGGVQLQGEVRIGGAKNSALPIMTATILSAQKNTIQNVPDLEDVKTMCSLICYMGSECSYQDGLLTMDTTKINRYEAPYELVKTMRASVLILGPLLARYGKAKVSLPGGCAIGARPINLHLMGLQLMGANINLDSGYVVATAPKLKGACICFDTITVTGTENLMMAATLAEGKTVLKNAAMEPEVVDLGNALISMGAQIKGLGTTRIEIEGVESLNPLNDYSIICDRIEAGTFMAAAGITGGSIVLKCLQREHMDAVIAKFIEAGLTFKREGDGLRVTGPDIIKATDIQTVPYPGFPTDMQAQFMALMCRSNGISMIKENIFENRFMHVAELRRMGALIKIQDHVATVQGNGLKGAPVMATDLRASASLVLAALAAEGASTVQRIYHLDRGYERLELKLASLGAHIQRVRGVPN